MKLKQAGHHRPWATRSGQSRSRGYKTAYQTACWARVKMLWGVLESVTSCPRLRVPLAASQNEFAEFTTSAIFKGGSRGSVLCAHSSLAGVCVCEADGLRQQGTVGRPRGGRLEPQKPCAVGLSCLADRRPWRRIQGQPDGVRS